MTLITKTMEVEGAQNAKTVNLLLNNIQADVLYLSKTPPIQGMIRAEANRGIDPLDKSTYQSWVKRLEIIFFSILESRSYYDKIRFLDENGNEIVRVNNQQNKTVIATKPELENERENEYFQEALKLKPGEFYTSPVNLTRTADRIEYPHKLVIR